MTTLAELLNTPKTYNPNARNTHMTTDDQDRTLDRIFDREEVLSLDVTTGSGLACAGDNLGRTWLVYADGSCPLLDAVEAGRTTVHDQHRAAQDDARYLRGH